MSRMERRTFTGRELLLASHNPSKLAEMKFLLGDYDIAFVTAGDLGLAEPEETGTTFVENARLKALFAANAANRPALADDSGLCVDALDGEPGVYTADWAGKPRNWDTAMRLVEEKLQAAGALTPERRGGTFVSTLCLAWPDGHTQEYRGEVRGTLIWPPRRGPNAYGYDPVFQPESSSRTFGEMTALEKHGFKRGVTDGLSHRARSIAAFARDCLD